ncbi:MAG: glycosyl transferase [Candidatus Contendobacter odensis]|uniref:Glycosyl transferase n=1 Tax=Candidatus Contendibacter odensensis TaxID=1400860 RepID=A0A2G6PE07_9GAMM|nr:MAG: glycosyl transferase [Candidatus Contendobacter odensis]
MIVSAHIIGGEALGGAELFYARFINALLARQYPVLAVTAPGSQVGRLVGTDAVQAKIPMRGVWDVLSRWQISQLLCQYQPEIVQTYMGRATRLTHVPPGRRPVHIARLGGYYNPHGYRHAHAWVVNSAGIRSHLIQHGFPEHRIFLVSNFVAPCHPSSADELGQLRCELSIPDDALIVTTVGRLHPVKGFENLLAAFAKVPAQIHDRPVYLVVVGDGPLATQLLQYAEQLGISHRVRWPGWRNDAGRFQELAHLCVCSSIQEGLGNIILESWARRRAMLSTCAQGPADTITDREDGWLVPVGQPAAFASAIEHLLRDDALRYQLAENGHRTLISRHSEKTIVNDYLAMYQQLLMA